LRWVSQTPGIQPYAVGAKVLSEEGVAALQALRENLGSRQLPVPLLVDQATAAYPWEAVLQLALPVPENGERPAGTFQFWRDTTRAALSQKSVSPGERADNPNIAGQQVLTGLGQGQVHVIGDPIWRSAVIPAWSSLDPGATIDTEPSRVKSLDRAPAILHLLGKPIQSGGGVLLTIDPQSDSGVTQKSFSRSADILIDPDELPLDSVQMVVVQHKLGELRDFRQDTEREKMGYLRVLAAQVAERDVGAVLTLPLLSSQLTEAVLGQIVSAMQGDESLSVGQLLEMAAAVRHCIVQWPLPSGTETDVLSGDDNMGTEANSLDPDAYAKVMTELALDVTLFIKRRLSE
jgi:hypothetical protein